MKKQLPLITIRVVRFQFILYDSIFPVSSDRGGEVSHSKDDTKLNVLII